MKYAEYVQQLDHLKVPLEGLKEVLEKRPLKRWCYIVHDKDEREDGTLKEPHIHVYMQMKSDQTPESLAKWFSDEPQYIERAKNEGSNNRYVYENMVSYGLHETENADGKHHYEPSEMVANFDVPQFIEGVRKGVAEAKEKRGRSHPLAEVLQMICNNQIPRLKIGDHVQDLDRIRYSREIEQAYKIRDEKLAREVNRQMDVLYIEGASGTGKTTLAKMLAYDKGYDVFVSGSSNDPFEGYRGQECVILDDIRGSDWKINDLLKILDNHTNSLVKSRYSNKLLVDCKLMVLTSVQPLEEMYGNLKEHESEPIEQLKRRCSQYIQLTKSSLSPFKYNEAKKEYEAVSKPIPNPVPMMNFIQENSSVLTDVANMVARIKAERDATPEGEQLSLFDDPNKDLPF